MVCRTLAVTGAMFALAMVFAYIWLFGALGVTYELSWSLERSNGGGKGRWSTRTDAFEVGHTGFMTEQQVKVFEAKLTRIWGAVAPFRVRPDHDGFDLTAPVSQGVELRVLVGTFDTRNCAQYALHEIGPNLAFLRCNDFFDLLESPQTLLGEYHTNVPQDIRHLQNEWMPHFRRCCWLCSCDIEATAEEKAEWVRGFTQEEIESWKLKM